MRWLPAALLAAGLILGVVLPIAGSGRLPVLLGAACLLAAGVLAARQASRARFLLVLLGILGAVLVVQLPRLVTDARNGQGIAWEARAGERIVLAEAGVAVTSSDKGRTLTGRDIGNGGGKWQIEFPRDGFAGSEPFVSRVGRTLVVVDGANKLRAIDLGTGRQRWDAPAADGFVLPAVADAEFVAATHCREGGRCTVEVRALRDGSVRWKAPSPPTAPGSARRRSPRRSAATARSGPRARSSSACRRAGPATSCASWPPGRCSAAAPGPTTPSA